jgi:hypothetical protein
MSLNAKQKTIFLECCRANLPQDLLQEINTVTVLKKTYEVDKIKKYDVIHAPLPCNPKAGRHFHIVIKVTKEYVYTLSITSDEQAFTFFKYHHDRVLNGYLSNMVHKIPLHEAQRNFCFHLEAGIATKAVRAAKEILLQEYNNVLK